MEVKSGEIRLYSSAPVPSLPLPTDQIDPASDQVPSLGREVASDVSSEMFVRDSTKRASSGDSVTNPTKVCLGPACRRLEVSTRTSKSGFGLHP